MRPSIAALAFAVVLPSSCRRETAPAPQAASRAKDDAVKAAQVAARDAAMSLGKTLKARLLAAMNDGRPPSAIEVCASEAQPLTARIGAETGASVGRASLRTRNPASAGPDWVRARLAALGERPAEGVAPFTEIATVGTQPVARFAGPIAVEAQCLVCHGAREQIPPEVRTVLDARYPSDRAHGYAIGDLRGLIYAEVPVQAPR